MKQHDFIPLVTFRGWNSYIGNFIHGSLDYTKKYCTISGNYGTDGEHGSFFVDKDSLGVYIGECDKNETPIFCGVASAENGSDFVNIFDETGELIGRGFVHFADGCFKHTYEEYFDGEPSGQYRPSKRMWPNCEVYGNQYEQHLKDSK